MGESVIPVEHIMANDIHQFLLDNDSATDVECPASFDWHKSMTAVKALKPHAERILGLPLKLDENVRDASYFTELCVRRRGRLPGWWIGRSI